MPWCEKAGCGKTGLKPDEIVFDEVNKLVLCLPCGDMEKRGPQGVVVQMPRARMTGKPPEFEFGIHIDSREGLSAEASYGDVTLRLHASKEELKKLAGMDENANGRRTA